MKKSTYLFAIALGVSSVTLAQNVGINTDGSDPDTDALLHLLNTNSTALDPLIRLENQQGASVNGIELLNSGGATAAEWDLYIPSTTTDLRISNGTTDRITIQNDGDVGIGTTSPTVTLDVDGDAIFNESGAAKDFRIESDANTHQLYVDGTNNEIGVNTSTPASGLEVNTSMGLKLNTITSATTLDQTHNVVLCNTGAYTVTLPAAASNTGKVYYIKNIDSDGDNINIDGNGSETINGATTYVLHSYNDGIRIVSDGTGWHVIEESLSPVYEASFTAINCDASTFTWSDVTNATTGKTWMDRNLGATQVATSSTDADSYGDLYQWGRLKDGHQCRASSTSSTNSADNVPGHDDFILEASSPYDWRDPQNTNLWQGTRGINNPCPGGYRLPTETELDAERTSWGSNNAAGAFGSVLKLPLAGYRSDSNGSLGNVGTYGYYWTSTVSVTVARVLDFYSSYARMDTYYRAGGFSVRCLKD
jgi:uncharacterized protein (TIGR02145 family)